MNTKDLCIGGLKILLALGAAAIVYAGTSGKLSGSKNNNGQCGNNNGNSGNSNQVCGGWGNDFENTLPPQTIDNNANSVGNNLKRAHETCGKMATFMQSLMMVIEGVSRIFSPGTFQYQQPNLDPWGWNNNPSPGDELVGFRQISPFALEPVTRSSMSGYSNYGVYGNGW